jgi:hypothetical protein
LFAGLVGHDVMVIIMTIVHPILIFQVKRLRSDIARVDDRQCARQLLFGGAA